MSSLLFFVLDSWRKTLENWDSLQLISDFSYRDSVLQKLIVS